MFCTKCGNKLADNAKFCNKCGEEVGGRVIEQTAGSAASTANPAVEQISDQAAKFSPEAQPSAEAKTTQSSSEIQPSAAAQPTQSTTLPSSQKKYNTPLLVVIIILGVLAIVAVTAVIVFALNSQNSNTSTHSSANNLLSDVNSGSDIDVKFNQIIKENEQLKAWWDCEKDKLSYCENNFDEDYIFNINYSLKNLNYLTDFYPDINVTAASPSRYAKIDMNDDGQVELVVMGKNPYYSEAIIGVYYYDNSTGKVKMSKVNNSDFSDSTDCYTDVICPDKTIKSTYSANGGETLSVYKMQGDSVEKVGDYSGYLGKAQNQTELAQAQKQTDEFNNIKNNYVEDESIAWVEFNSVDPVYTMTGTIKMQTAYERITDANTRSAYIDVERKNTDTNSPYYNKNHELLIFERDGEKETACFSGGGPYITGRKIVAYSLGGGTNVDKEVSSSADYSKLKDFKDKKVTITLNMKKALAASDAAGWGVDVYVADDSVIDIEETQVSDKEESTNQTSQNNSNATEQLTGFWKTPNSGGSGRIYFLYLKPDGSAESGEVLACSKVKGSTWAVDSTDSSGKVTFHVIDKTGSTTYIFDPSTQIVSCPSKNLTSVDDGVTKLPYTMTKGSVPEEYETGFLWNHG